MKHIIMYIAASLFFAMVTAPLCAADAHPPMLKRLVLTSGGTVRITPDNAEKTTYALNYATAELFLRGLEAKCAWQTDTTAFVENGSPSSPTVHEPAWSAVLRADDFFTLPCALFAGNIKAGGSAAKLRSPAISTGTNALGVIAKNASQLTILKPGASGYKTPLGTALSANLRIANGKFRLYAATFMNEDEETLFGMQADLPAVKAGRLSFSYTAGSTIFEGKSASWFSPYVLFPEERYVFQSAQAAFASKRFCAKYTANAMQSVQQKDCWNLCLSAEHMLTQGAVRLVLSGFYSNCPQTFTASGSHLKTNASLRINPQYAFFTPNGAAKITAGALLFIEEKNVSGGKTALRAKTALSSEARTQKSLTTLNFAITGIEAEPWDFYSATYAGTLKYQRQKKAAPGTSIAVAHAPKTEKTTYKVAAHMKLPCQNAVQARTTCTAVQTEKDLKSVDAELKVQWRKKQKRLSVSTAFCIKYAVYSRE